MLFPLLSSTYFCAFVLFMLLLIISYITFVPFICCNIFNFIVIEKLLRIFDLHRRQCPQSGRLISWGWQEREICWMPSARNDFVCVLSYYHRWQWHGKITLQIGQNQFVVVAASEQIISGWWESDGSAREIGEEFKKCSGNMMSHSNILRIISSTHRMSDACGLKHCIGRFPRMSYKTHELSSWPETNNRPDGSTQIAATGEPCREPGTVAGVTVFTQPRVRKSQKRTVLS